MSKINRAKLVSVKAVVEYSDGARKEVDIDLDEYEALFWSDRAVLEILAPFYKQHREYSAEDLRELSEELGEDLQAITPDVVERMWNTSVDGTENGDRPIIVGKKIKCIPATICTRCPS